jgi:hypothetical protein
MREIAKARARALEFIARMSAAGLWPPIPPPFILAKLPPEKIATLIAKLKEAGRWPLPPEHEASAILTQRENEGNKMNKMVAMTEAQFPSKATADNEASRASVKRGRKTVVTPERINTICELLTRGESERSACIRAGIGSTAWGAAKRNSAALRERIARARDQWATVRHERHTAALHESQAMRSANRKALKPQPTHQAKLVVWHLTTRVPLNLATIPETEIASACERFNLRLETWRTQERAFGLLQKVYAKRAAIRGQQCQTPAADSWAGPMPSRQLHIDAEHPAAPGAAAIELPEQPSDQDATACPPGLWWITSTPVTAAPDDNSDEPLHVTNKDGVPRLR